MIALVITIIILIILAAVTINLTMGDNGLFTTAKKAAKDYKDAQEKELAGLDLYSNTVNDTLEELDGKVVLNGKWSNEKKVNMPKIANTGLTAVKLNENETAGISAVSEEVETANNDTIPVTSDEQQKESWYSYNTTDKQWANAVSKDGSMWVWIPRFAYKITPKAEGENAGKIDVVFLKGTTDEPAEKSSDGKDVTNDMIIRAKNITGETDISNKYIVHPAFTDESKTGYANGGWDKEIPGFWIAKFEAGYAGTAGNESSATDSNVKYSTIMSYNGSTTADLSQYFYGEREVGTKIKYPTFMPNRPSFNYIGIADAYDLCMDIKNGKEAYNLSNIDSHLIKNSEWGAVAYLAHSAYGQDGTEIRNNNVSADGTHSIWAVTGYGAASTGAGTNTLSYDNLIAGTPQGNWESEQGQFASTTGNLYGVYDMSGGLYELTAGYITTNGNYNTYGGNLKGESNKYKSKYVHNNDGENYTANYNEAENTKRKGEAIWETSTAATGTSGWFTDSSCFVYSDQPFPCRGSFWNDKGIAGMFALGRAVGYCYSHVGFRAVLVAE